MGHRRKGADQKRRRNLTAKLRGGKTNRRRDE
jgi:hypothetical protein